MSDDTTTETTEAADTGTAPEATETVDWQAEAEKWRSMARKQESRAKDSHKAVKELEAIKESQLTETERAVKAARDEGAASVRAEYAAKLVSTTFRAAAKGRVSDPDALLSSLNLANFMSDDGEPDEDAITAFLDSIAPAKQEDEKPAGTASLFEAQGTRNSSQHLPLNGDPILAKVNSILGIR